MMKDRTDVKLEIAAEFRAFIGAIGYMITIVLDKRE